MRFNDQRDWFFQKRFGMFVHWGIYAIPAWHEQILWRQNLDPNEYKKYKDVFNPTAFDPYAWVDLMEEAGMEYICFTTKHHDGFCMWDTKQTDYNIMNTPYRKDILKLLTDACRKRGIKVGLYYSCVDWDHPFYPNIGRSHELASPKPGDSPDIDRYYVEYVTEQVKELCTGYGTISQFFWDLNSAKYQNPDINRLIRRLQPEAVINDRGPDSGDYGTPERMVPDGQSFDSATEACQSVGRHSWGYKKDEDYFSVPHLINSMDKILCMGGNYLLNVGPDANGCIPDESKRILHSIGRWYKKVKEAFTETVPATYMTSERNIWMTRKDNILYVHVMIPSMSDAVILPPIDILPKSAILLNNGRELETRVDMTPYYFKEKPYLRIRNIPIDDLCGEVPVIKLVFDENIYPFTEKSDKHVVL